MAVKHLGGCKVKKVILILIALNMVTALCSCGNAVAASIPDFDINGELVKSQNCGVKINAYGSAFASKPEENANPLIANIFCADPTAVEYNGRLYVYGTNDHQQYEAVGSKGSNTYEKIKSIVMLSTDDMVNWTYHGIACFDKR